jgi:hypothetical protein
MQNPTLYRGEVGQLQEVVDTNEAHLGDNYSSSQIFLGHHSLPHQIQYFAGIKSTDQHQGKHLVVASLSVELIRCYSSEEANTNALVKIFVSIHSNQKPWPKGNRMSCVPWIRRHLSYLKS